MSALYDGADAPLFGSPPEPDTSAFPACRVLFDHDNSPEWGGGDVDRQWLIPAGSDPVTVAPDVLADLMSVLDRGGRIAVLAMDAVTVEMAIGAVLLLAGGGHA